MSDAEQFQILCDRRDLSAYNCANAIQFVLSFFEAQDFEQSREYLQSALDQHQEADDAITEFHLRISLKEKQSDGHRTTA